MPRQNSVAEQLSDLSQDAEHEAENEVGQAAENADGVSLKEEEPPTESYPSVEDNDQDSQSIHTEEDAAVIGLDVLEAEIIDEQGDGDEYDNGASATLHDDSQQGDEIDLDNRLAEDSFPNALLDGGSQTDENDEVDQELADGADEQGEEISHEHTKYAEPEAEFGGLFALFHLFHSTNVNIQSLFLTSFKYFHRMPTTLKNTRRKLVNRVGIVSKNSLTDYILQIPQACRTK